MRLAAEPGVPTAPLGASAAHPSLARSFSWVLAGNVGFALGQWALVIMLAKLTTQEQLGRFALATAVNMPIVLFANAQLRTLVATDARAAHPFGVYVALRLASTLLAAALVATIALAGDYGAAARWAILLFLGERVLWALSDLLLGLCERSERMDVVGRSLLLRAALTTACFGAGVLLTRDLRWGLVGSIVAAAITLVLHDARHAARAWAAERPATAPGARRPLRPEWDGRALAALTRVVVPLGIAQLVVSGYQQMPRYIVPHFLGERALGVFTAVVHPVNIGGLLVTTSLSAVAPRLGRWLAAGDVRAFRRTVGWVTLATVLIGVGGILVAAVAGREVLALLYTPEYAAETTLFVWVMVTALFSFQTSIVDAALTAARSVRPRVPLTLAAAAAALLVGWTMVPRHGLVGATLTTMAGALLHTLGGWWLLHRALRSTGGVPTTPLASGERAAAA